MKIITLSPDMDLTPVVREAVEVLRAGGVIVYPTDTLYGLGANALDSAAVEKVSKIKKRDRSKPLPVIVRNLEWAKSISHISKRQEKFLQKIWPGKITAIVPKKPIVPDLVTAMSKGIGMRVPDYPLVDKILSKFGYPLTSTSANISGEEASRDIQVVLQSLAAAEVLPDLVLDAGVLPVSEPSTVLDLTNEKPIIVRVGAASPAKLLELLEI
ncbi:MAG: threonylcarbamoyl-AMP synthase [Candidatus Yanofskybacteria bacterium]|nr:threonylcarbamoyl-AMP synthase [Candidatus Yanofskybacteria bacterium]